VNKRWVWPGVLGVVTYGATAHANVELPSAIDARNTGVGSTGVATSDNGLFPRPGVTATYDDPAVLRGQKVELNARLIEAAPGLSYSITDAVSLGLTYRVTYRMQSLTLMGLSTAWLPTG
jgi:hypothetical protein